MIRPTTFFARSIAIVISAAMVNLGMPMGLATFAPDPNAPKKAVIKPEKQPSSHMLTSREMKRIQGKSAESPYTAGASKMDVIVDNVDLVTGNYSFSETDLTFEGGYGIPVNVTRTYSANQADTGPLGKGWSLSVDVRSTAGGVLKSSGAPIMSVPTNFKERPTAQVDPNVPVAPAAAVVATDAAGKEETIQKDADGVLTTPPWDKNEIDSTYELVSSGGNIYRILKANTVRTLDGTTYVYAKQGSYTAGMLPFGEDTGTPEPSNVLKIMSATDRQGNATTYTYDSGRSFTFLKANGSATEHPLTAIQMPNGHEIDFTWNNTKQRLTSASDGVRTVTYTFDSSTGTDGPLLIGVTTPAGLTTSYGYNSTDVDFGVETGATNILQTITNPQGLVTTINSQVSNSNIVLPYFVGVTGVRVTSIIHPNNVNFFRSQSGSPGGVFASEDPNEENIPTPFSEIDFWRQVGTTYDTNVIEKGSLIFGFDPTLGTMDVIVRDGVGLSPVLWDKTYDVESQNLISATTNTWPQASRGATLQAARHFPSSDFHHQSVTQETEYNFGGNPLTQTVTEKEWSAYDTATTVRTNTTEYAYWGADKYFQQKAVRSAKDGSGGKRYSFTEYYDNTAAAGSKGQTKRVYTSAFASFSGTGGTDWKYVMAPTDLDTHSAKFEYDSKGRATDVWKLQKTTTSPWTYVQTHTTYGADSSPIWGAATEVVEDYGSGKINRTTQTLAYDSIGRATQVQDAAGHKFETTYDLDGKIQSIDRIDVTPHVNMVAYTYGTTANNIINGQVTQIVDGLSGVSQAFSYNGASSGGATGQVASITETNGSSSYSTAYSYTDQGDRDVSTYTTPNGTRRWKYSDYISVGSPDSPKRAFQTLNRLNSTPVATSEEFHYSYDSSGRILNAAFAQSPQTGTGAPTSAPYYTTDYPANSRARAWYVYEPGGRLKDVQNGWETWNVIGMGYDGTPILRNERIYDAVKGLTSQSKFYSRNTSTNGWQLDRTEEFGYDANLDYLTSAEYGDSLTNHAVTWTYDAAGNRATDSSQTGTWTYDNLNRMTSANGTTCTYDILGNQLTKGSSRTVTYDALNRMISHSKTSGSNAYQYRADGMRVHKAFSTPSPLTMPYDTDFFYDGQMGFEDDEVHAGGGNIYVNRYGLGARGIDFQETTTNPGGSQTVAVTYPLYDGHGNMVATIAKSGSSFTLGNQRAFDAWGGIRQGATSGNPRGRYCASLGHVVDDESGLVYMRARYYEPASGRFISEDSQSAGLNWYTYCNNNPVGAMDASGHNSVPYGLIACLLLLMGSVLMGIVPQIAAINRIIEIDKILNKTYMPFADLVAQGDVVIKADNEIMLQAKALLDERSACKAKIGRVGSAITAIMGYTLIIWALILDVDMPDGVDALSTVHGES